MKPQSLYLIALLLINWTASFAQSGTSKDTSKTYGLTDLRHIAETAVNLKTCDTLLSTAKKELANRDTLLKEKEYVNTQLSLKSGLKDEMLKNRDDSLKKQTHTIKKLNNKIKLIKVGWVASVLAEAALILYFIIHH